MENIKLIKPRHVIGITFGSLFSAAAIKLFVQVGTLVPSGVAGISSLLVMEFDKFFGIKLSFSVLYLLVNLGILSFVFKHLGKKFITLSLMHVVLTSIFVEILPITKITNDMILIAVFGGLMNGIGVSIALKMNGSAGGSDFIAIYFSKVKNKPMWDKIMYFNIAMLLYFGWQYNWNLAFYSIIYQVISTRIIDTYHDRYKLSSIRIITTMPEEVSTEILKTVRHGITKLDGMGMYKRRDKSLLYMVVNTFEVDKIVKASKVADPCAFIEIGSVDRIEGNYYQQPLD